MIKYWISGMLAGCFFGLFSVQAQTKPERWDLKSCIGYAREQNIQIRKNRIVFEQSKENLQEAKAQRLPSLGFSSSHNYVNRPGSKTGDRNAYTGSYSLNSSFVLYQGGIRSKQIRQMDLQTQVEELGVQEAENSIELAIIQAFLQVLYASETVGINEKTVEVAEAQRNRGRELLKAGALAQPDLAQLESQYTADKYQLVVARTTLDNNVLELKQLLELGMEDSLQLILPEISDDSVLLALPMKQQVYRTALEIMPEIRYNRLNIQVVSLEKQKARAGYLPELDLSVGVGSSHISGSGYTFGTQLKENWSENVGLTLSVPVFSNRSHKTAVNLAKLNVENAELGYESIQKDLLKTIETIWQDALSAQERFRSARENLKAVEQSFALVEQQFFLGMKNTLEMLTEKNNLLSARQEMLQAKYMAVLNRLLLDFYQGREIRL